MKRQIITAFIAVLILAPSVVLADSRYRFYHHESEEHESEEHESEEHESDKHKGFSRSIRSRLKLLGFAIANINTEIETLKLQVGDLPPDLNAKLIALQSAIDNNASDISLALSDIVLLLEDISVIMSTQGNQGNRLNLLESSVAEISISLGLLSSTVDDLELRVLALEQAGPPPAISVNFSGAFTHLAVADAEVQQAWQDFRNNATGSFQSIEIRNSLGGSVICSDSVVATQIANELNLFTHGPGFASFACGSQIWNVGTCGGIELNAGSVTGVCRCGQNAVVRPTIANDNWGGVSTEFGGSGGTCDAPSQTLEVILTR